MFTYLIGDGVEGRYIDTSDDTPERIPLGLSTHYHTAWVFTALGDYVFKVTPRLFPKTLGTLTGVPREFRFHVGTRLVPEEPAPALTLESQGPYRAGEAVELRSK